MSEISSEAACDWDDVVPLAEMEKAAKADFRAALDDNSEVYADITIKQEVIEVVNETQLNEELSEINVKAEEIFDPHE